MFSEPQTVTLNAVAKSLPRTGLGSYDGTFESDAEGLKLRISHQFGKRTRRTVRLDSKDIAADPYLDGTNRPVSMSAYLVVDVPPVGYTSTEISHVVQGLIDCLDEPANLSKVLGSES
jgi:hypothetical protein